MPLTFYLLLPRAVLLDLGEQGGMIFLVGVEEQGRMRRMAVREGTARLEFQTVLAMVHVPNLGCQYAASLIYVF